MRWRTKFEGVVGAGFTSGHLVVTNLVWNGTLVPGLAPKSAVVMLLVPTVRLECGIMCGMRTKTVDSAHLLENQKHPITASIFS